MKRLLALLAALMVLLGGAAFAEAADYVGYWVMTSAEVSGMTVDPAMLGLTAFMKLYEDGTCWVVMGEQKSEGTWAATASGVTIDLGGERTEFTLTDGALVLPMDGGKLIYTPEAYTLPLSGLTLPDFNGDWVCAYLEVDGMTYDAVTLGADLRLHLADGAGQVYMGSADGAEEFDALCEVEEDPEIGTVMYVYFLENGQPCGDGMVLMMYDNGELVWCDSYESHDMFYCFVPAE